MRLGDTCRAGSKTLEVRAVMHACVALTAARIALGRYGERSGEITLLACVTLTAVLSTVMSRGW